ncbi:MAG TPA: condensation domain-containing protein, partial [Rhizobium sp.]
MHNSDLLRLSREYSSLQQEKKRLFRRRMREHGISSRLLPIMPAEEHIRSALIAPEQESLWLTWQANPRGTEYNLSSALHVAGQIDPEKLRRAFVSLVRRHRILRTTFAEKDGTVHQFIHDEPKFDWIHRTPLSSKGDWSPAQVQQRLDEVSRLPFDLANGPLLRVHFLPLDDGGIIHVTCHHIIADAHSLTVAFRELEALYASEKEDTEDRATTLPENSIQYGDYAIWQREWLDEEALGEQLAYWRTELDPLHPPIELPFRQQNIRSLGAGDRFTLDVPAALRIRLHGAARKCKASLSSILLTAFSTILNRYSAQNELYVGIPINRRQRHEIADTIGYFANTTVAKIELDQRQAISKHIARVHDRLARCQEFSDLPISQLIADLKPARFGFRSPVFQVMYNFVQSADSGAGQFAGFQAKSVATSAGGSQFDLTLSVTDAAETLSLTFAYATDLLERAMVERLAGHYVEVLEQIAEDGGAEKRLSEIALSVPVEHPPLATYAFVPVTERIAEQAALHP